MPVVTFHFVKDLIFSLVFLVGVYFLVHNPITQPTPEYHLGMWSVETLQHPLLLGLAGHNYLILRNDKGQIVSELHGLATDASTGTYKYFGTKKTDELKVWEFSSIRYSMKEYQFPGVVLTQGDVSTTLTLWGLAKNCMAEINKKDILYSLYGINLLGTTENSNSATYTLAQCMGLDIRHIGIFTPGSQTDLLESR